MTKADQLESALREGWQSTEDLHLRFFWQPTTMRGSISAMAKKKSLKIEPKRENGITSYRIAEQETCAS